MNSTIMKFGYPNTLVKEYEHWVVLSREPQCTLGSCVVAAKSQSIRFHELEPDAFYELCQVSNDLETCLSHFVEFEKINWLMLMMFDPHVHFHVVPRYSIAKRFAGVEFRDPGWPGAPDLTLAPRLSSEQSRLVIDELRKTL